MDEINNIHIYPSKGAKKSNRRALAALAAQDRSPLEKILSTAAKMGVSGAVGLNSGVIAAGERISNVMNNGAESALDLIRGGVESASSKIKTIGLGGLNTTKNALSFTGSMLSNTSEAFGAGVNLFGVGVRGVVGGLAEGSTVIGSAILGKANATVFNSSIQLNKGIGTVLGNTTKIVADWLDDEKNTIKDMKDNFRKNISSLGTNFSNGFQVLKEGFKDKVSAIRMSLHGNEPNINHAQNPQEGTPQQKQKQGTKQPNTNEQQSVEVDTTSEERELSPEETKTKVLQRTEDDIKRRSELRKNLDEQREYLRKKREHFNAVQNKINETSSKISDAEKKNPNLSAAYDKNSKKISAAIEEYRKELSTAAENTRIGGTNKLDLRGSNYNEEIAKRAFKDEILAAGKEGPTKGQATAVSHYLNKERLVRLNKIQENLAKEISPLINESGGFSARGAIRAKHRADIAAKSGGWKGKAAIFGGIAAGALALTGVASLMMSGGRQENSNLYNPYQAMY